MNYDNMTSPNDVCLLAPTRKSLQLLLDTCSDYANTWCIAYNEKKTKVMYFGKNYASLSACSLYLNGKELEFVNQWKYLGMTITSGSSFFCSSQKPLTTFIEVLTQFSMLRDDQVNMFNCTFFMPFLSLI